MLSIARAVIPGKRRHVAVLESKAEKALLLLIRRATLRQTCGNAGRTVDVNLSTVSSITLLMS